MGRRRSSFFTDIIEISAKLHWKAGLIAAALSYLGFHIASVVFSTRAAGPKNLADFSHALPGQFIGIFATFLQFLVPFACVVGAIVSFIRRSHGLALFKDAQSRGSRAVDSMTWSEFELLVASAFRAKGFSVTDNVVGGPDGGVDLRLRKSDQTYLVQCKQWKARNVGVAIVQELYGVIAAQGAAGGYVITSGKFSHEAHSFATRCAIILIDGAQLSEMIGSARQTNVIPIRSSEAASRAATHTKDYGPPVCPRCGAEMVQRTAQRGSTPGAKFWGCSNFPKCRATAQVSGGR